VLWFLVLIGLPLTSFPILNRLTGAIVAPFSAIPLALLMLVWLVPYLLERGTFPAEIVPYLYFVLVAVIISGLAFFLNGYYARGRDFFDQSIRAFVTVAIGLSFYLTFAVYPRDEKTFRQTLLFIYIGGALLIGWTTLEVFLLRTYVNVRDMPGWFLNFRALLAIQSPNIQFSSRVTGFAYEPSWFVREFNLVLFPIWLSAVYQRKSIFKFRLWKIQVEDILMLAGLIVFGFSSPRVGLVAFLASVAYLGFLFLRGLHRRIMDWYLKRRKQPPKQLIWVKVVLAALMVTIMLVAAGSALVGYVVVASRWDDRYELLLEDARMSRLEIFPMTEGRLVQFARELAFFERMIYWFGGWNIFNDYPLGVGLGNAGFYFVDRMNGAGFDSLEMRNLVYRANYLPNTKNMWTRLLSETGFIGLAVFLVWLYILWRSAGLIRKSESKVMKIVGLAGQLFLLAYLVESLSMDSFAMPYQWVMAGLISAGGLFIRCEMKAKDTPQVSESLPA
jgi:hypothetical protein